MKNDSLREVRLARVEFWARVVLGFIAAGLFWPVLRPGIYRLLVDTFGKIEGFWAQVHFGVIFPIVVIYCGVMLVAFVLMLIAEVILKRADG